MRNLNLSNDELFLIDKAVDEYTRENCAKSLKYLNERLEQVRFEHSCEISRNEWGEIDDWGDDSEVRLVESEILETHRDMNTFSHLTNDDLNNSEAYFEFSIEALTSCLNKSENKELEVIRDKLKKFERKRKPVKMYD